ncbi:alpha/beta hydrolase family protein [Desulfocicer vacuolatum]|nr:alpha/beta hydrolase family protein [Desulfocicer vacuolatum]
MRTKTFYISIFSVFFLFSCAHVPLDSHYNGPYNIPDSIKAQYAYAPYRGSCDEVLLHENQDYSIKQIKLTSTKNIIPSAGHITMDYYAIKGPGKKPLVMVLPILGGSNNVAELFAGWFAKNGMAALIVHRHKAYKKIKEVDSMDTVLRQIVFDHMQVLDWIETRKELDLSNIGVFGVSMGGIKAALVSSLDRRIKASVFVLAGGDIPYILRHSTDKGVQKKRERYLQKNRLSEEQFYIGLKKNITCDPLHYAHYINAENSLMVLAVFDRVVPFSKGLQLREKMGKPETIYLLGGHYSSIIYVPYIQYKALSFFRRKFIISQAGP